MKILEFIEDILNKILLVILNQIIKFIPPGLKNAYQRSLNFISRLKFFFLSLPKYTINFFKKTIDTVKPYLSLKGILLFIKEAQDFSHKYYQQNKAQGLSKIKLVIEFPVVFIKNWSSHLSRWQIYSLLSLSAVSLVAAFYIFQSVETIVLKEISRSRYPASSSDFDRPVYYKKEFRHLELSSFRLPIFIPKLNELKSIDLDFTMTLSNKSAKQFLEKHEFELRDHLLHEVELIEASFPLENEGKDIIKAKLIKEVNHYLKQNDVEGSVEEIQLIYILAN